MCYSFQYCKIPKSFTNFVVPLFSSGVALTVSSFTSNVNASSFAPISNVRPQVRPILHLLCLVSEVVGAWPKASAVEPRNLTRTQDKHHNRANREHPTARQPRACYAGRQSGCRRCRCKHGRCWSSHCACIGFGCTTCRRDPGSNCCCSELGCPCRG